MTRQAPNGEMTVDQDSANDPNATAKKFVKSALIIGAIGAVGIFGKVFSFSDNADSVTDKNKNNIEDVRTAPKSTMNPSVNL